MVDDAQSSADKSPADRGSGSPGNRVRRRVILTASVFVLVDFVSKQIAVAGLEGRAAIQVIPGLLRLWVGRNPGAAFSLGARGATVVFTVVACAAVLAIVAFAPRLVGAVRSPLMLWAVALLLAGAAGNLVDRLVRAPGFGIGHVVDFIALPHFPIFNVSDMCITAAVVLYLLAGLSSGRGGESAPASAEDGR